MATKYSGTQTEKNLEAAFAGESQARNKYTYFASKAKKEGYEQIAALFEETALQRTIFQNSSNNIPKGQKYKSNRSITAKTRRVTL